jgi:hypothetical protein
MTTTTPLPPPSSLGYMHMILIPFNDYEKKVMDRYLWLDYSIERIWQEYYKMFYGKYDLDNEEEMEVIKMMETVYDFETQIIDLLDSTYIDFFMIDQYKEQCGVRNWPTRLC